MNDSEKCFVSLIEAFYLDYVFVDSFFYDYLYTVIIFLCYSLLSNTDIMNPAAKKVICS